MAACSRTYPVITILVMLLVTAATARAQVDDWALANAVVNSVRTPQIPAREFKITDFGAIAGDGVDARPAIMAAIEKAAAKGGGRVVIPKGNWSSKGPIILQSKINLYIAKGATLRFSADPADYLPAVPTRREGIELQGYSPLIYAVNVHDVAITGSGVIDGNSASGFHQWTEKQQSDREKLRLQDAANAPAASRVYGKGAHLPPAMIQFLHAERVLLEDAVLHNAPYRSVHLARTDHAGLHNIRIDNSNSGGSGVEIDSTTYVVIENSRFRTGESPLSILSTRDRDGREARRPAAYIVVRNCDMGGQQGILFPGPMAGGIRNVFFSDIVLGTGAHAMLFEADMNRGGAVEHVRVRNLSVESSKGDLFRFELDMSPSYKGHPPAYRDFVFENVTAGDVGVLLGARAPKQAPLQDLLLKNLAVRRAEHDFMLENVEELRLEDVRIGAQAINGRLDWKEPLQSR